MDLSGLKVFVAGHQGMAGSAIMRRLAHENCDLVTAPRSQVDLTRQQVTEDFLLESRPDLVIIAAARVGGIKANTEQPVEFLQENLLIEVNLIKASFQAGVRRLLLLGSTCAYPRLAQQPITEDALLTGALEPTNEWYAVAKIAGIKLCQAYRRQWGAFFTSVMPSNLYGPGDNYHPDNSHVVGALIRRFNEAVALGFKEVTVWGTGTPRREFLFVDDLADACIHIIKLDAADDIINVGVGTDITIREFAEQVAGVVGFSGRIRFDPSKPDGTPRKLVDVGRIRSLGWYPKVSLETGLRIANEDFISRYGGATVPQDSHRAQ